MKEKKTNIQHVKEKGIIALIAIIIQSGGMPLFDKYFSSKVSDKEQIDKLTTLVLFQSQKIRELEKTDSTNMILINSKFEAMDNSINFTNGLLISINNKLP